MKAKIKVTLRVLILGLITGSSIDCGHHDEHLFGILSVDHKTPKDEDGNPKGNFDLSDSNFLLEKYESCGDLGKELEAKLAAENEYRQKSNDFRKAQPQQANASSADAKSQVQSMSEDSKSAPSASGEIATNIQEAGVDEADEIKIDGEQIFVLNNQSSIGTTSIAVVQQNPLKNLGSIEIADLSAANIYVSPGRLVVIGQKNGRGTRVLSYQTAPGEVPKLKKQRLLTGTLVDSRVNSGKLVLVSKQYLERKPYSQGATKAPQVFQLSRNSLQEWDCRNVYRTRDPKNFSEQVVSVQSLNLRSLEIIDEAVFPTDVDQIYMTEKNLYISAKLHLPLAWVNPYDESANQKQQKIQAQAQDTLVVTKVSFDSDSGKIEALAQGKVVGHLKQFGSSWAFKEITHEDDLYLSVATTTGNVRALTKEDTAKNHLFVLAQDSKELKVVGELRDFGVNEDIRSVRYIGTMAYVVTFQKTDPLFAIDLSVPTKPAILGELKIPGFSMYMHPVGSDRMIGVGFDTEESALENQSFYQGLLVQLFDIAKPDALERLDYKVLGKRGSYSEANLDHHAFYFDAEDSILGYPAVLFDDRVIVDSRVNGQQTHFTREFSGAVFYQTKGDNLVEIKRDSHVEFLPPVCQTNMRPRFWSTPLVAPAEIRRIFKSKGIMYTVSNYGVKTFSSDLLDDIAQVQLDFPDCRPIFGGGGFD